MHIVHCLTHSTLGGGQQVVYLLVKSFRKYYPDIKITVVLPAGGIFVKRFRDLGVAVEEFPFDKICSMNLFRIFTRFVKLEPDVIHTHGKGAGFYARLLPGIFLKQKIVHSYHGIHLPVKKWLQRFYISFEKRLLAVTDKVISVSEGEKKTIGKIFLENKSIVIGNQIDSESLRKESEEGVPESVESFLKNQTNPFMVTMIGRNDIVKNYPLAIETAGLILKKNKRIVFIFIGLNSKDALITPLIKDYPEKVLVIDNVSNTAPVIKRSDVIMLTSKREGCPLVVLEAFVLGKPVVGTRVQGIEDIVEHSVNGLLCGESASLLANALGLLESDAQLYEYLKMNALITANRMNLEKWAAQYYDVYSKLAR